MIFLTDFADQAVILPVVAAIAIVLAASGWRRGVVFWLLAIGGTLGVMLVLKFGFLACLPVFSPWTLRSPSGHTAAAAVVVGGLAAVLTGRTNVTAVVAAFAALLIGFSRIELGFHSVTEVIVGGAVGIAGAVILSRFLGPPLARRPVLLLVVACVTAFLLHGIRLPAEAAIWRAASGALDFIPACQGDMSAPP